MTSTIASYEETGRISIQEVDEGGAWTEISELGYLDTDGVDHTEVTSELNARLIQSGYRVVTRATRVGETPISNGWIEYNTRDTWIAEVEDDE